MLFLFYDVVKGGGIKEEHSDGKQVFKCPDINVQALKENTGNLLECLILEEEHEPPPPDPPD